MESAEIVDLSSKHQVGQLSVSQENDEEHDGKTHEVLGTARHGAGQLTHGLIEVDELKKLRGSETVFALVDSAALLNSTKCSLKVSWLDYEVKEEDFFYLDPGKEDNNRSHVVKLNLQVG